VPAGGGAGPAAAAAGGPAPAAEKKEEEKPEEKVCVRLHNPADGDVEQKAHAGRVRRRYGLRSVRLETFECIGVANSNKYHVPDKSLIPDYVRCRRGWINTARGGDACRRTD